MTTSSFTLVVQQDMMILVNAYCPNYTEIRHALLSFSELIKHPQGVHTFRVTPITLWNAAASGKTANDLNGLLDAYATYPVPMKVKQEIAMWVGRYGLFVLKGEEEKPTVTLFSKDEDILERMLSDCEIGRFFSGRPQYGQVSVLSKYRGRLKRALTNAGYPVIDKVGYRFGEPLKFCMRNEDRFQVRDYQREAMWAFIGGEQRAAGDGVIVLPCGAGKTIVGIAAMIELQCETLILTSNTTSVKQWKREIQDRTTLEDAQIGEYTGKQKQVRPVTISTYQMMTYRQNKGDSGYQHMRLFHERNWGFIIYDEVHLLPAPVFRTTADLQATCRLGLTATLIREDGCERDVFSLIGPKRYGLPWRELERDGWIAAVKCIEVRVPLSKASCMQYVQAGGRDKARIAAENDSKTQAVMRILQRHPGVPTLIIGQYLQQLERLARSLSVPLLTGKVPQEERERLYTQFKQRTIDVLIVSKVANFAVDLPDATVAIQVSGSFGSRQEEAQRLGRLLRPKANGRRANFYSIVSEDTKERDYALQRQRFLVEQGYQYAIEQYEQQQEEDDHGHQAIVEADGTR